MMKLTKTTLLFVFCVVVLALSYIAHARRSGNEGGDPFARKSIIRIYILNLTFFKLKSFYLKLALSVRLIYTYI